MATANTSIHPGRRLRELMDRSCIQMPGAFNALCALAIRDAGFEACYISGAATSVSAGVPDVGILTLDHFARTISESATACGLPIIADADTGFGESEMVRRTVIEYNRAGAAGLHIEDQVFPKRCGHLDGKKLIPIEHQCEKIAAAVKAARDCSGGGGGFVICARTDARGVEGFDAAITRARAYLNSGADMIFPEGLTSEEEFADFARLLGASSSARRPYLLANMTEFGKSPSILLDRLASFGYACVIYPVSTLRVAMHATEGFLRSLRSRGEAGHYTDKMQTRQRLYGLIGYEPGVEWSFGC